MFISVAIAGAVEPLAITTPLFFFADYSAYFFFQVLQADVYTKWELSKSFVNEDTHKVYLFRMLCKL